MKTRPRKPADDGIILQGLGVSSGIAVGPAYVIRAGVVQVPEYSVQADQVARERRRFANAVAGTRRRLETLRTKTASLPASAAEEIGYLLDAYQHMLSDSRLVRGVNRRIAEQRINAEAAVQAEMRVIADGFESMDDPYLAARVQEIREVGNRLVRTLTKTPYHAIAALPKGTVVIADELSPADTALMDPDRVAGLATLLGGAEGHMAIMARSLGLPAVVATPGLIEAAHNGDLVIVDGGAGRVILDPSPATVVDYRGRRAALRAEDRYLQRLRRLPAETRDGTPIKMQANLELPRDIDIAVRAGAEGVGLLRTEFLFMNRSEPPQEDEQYQALRDIILGMNGEPVTIRTLDIGGEKLTYSLGQQVGHGVNPALGLRAIRLSLKRPPLFETQLAAILRAGAHGLVRILLPMITTPGEVVRVRAILGKVYRRLKRRRVPMAPEPPALGVMIEVPGAALAADALAAVSDFFSVGTNDLTMYTLAIDRADDQVAYLYNPLHPAVLRLIQSTIESALRARIPVSVCGEMAGDARYTALLLGLGVRDLSMAPTALPRVKRRIRGLDLAAATERARIIMVQPDTGRIATLLDDFNALA
ncbi:MAG: phosphoenolpyruvate--protein phosphotransferase [Kiloniellales bacterium]